MNPNDASGAQASPPVPGQVPVAEYQYPVAAAQPDAEQAVFTPTIEVPVASTAEGSAPPAQTSPEAHNSIGNTAVESPGSVVATPQVTEVVPVVSVDGGVPAPVESAAVIPQGEVAATQASETAPMSSVVSTDTIQATPPVHAAPVAASPVATALPHKNEAAPARPVRDVDKLGSASPAAIEATVGARVVERS